MDIISEFVKDTVLKDLINDTTFPATVELKKYAHEVCHAYNLRVISMSVSGIHHRRANLVTESGIPCGCISLDKDSDNTYHYWLGLPTIRKERSGSKSGRGERDSNKISSLLRAIKKNKEEPTLDRIYKSMRRDFIAPLAVVESKSVYGRPNLSMPSSLQEVLTKHVLGVDTHSMAMYIDELKKVYSDHQLKMKSYKDSAKEIIRYRRGFTLIGVLGEGTSTYYLVGDASESNESGLTFHAPLKRYSTLKELPIAPVVSMINTYMQGKPNYDKDNELGLWLQDTFYDDLDIAVGYNNRQNGLWVAIPKEAP